MEGGGHGDVGRFMAPRPERSVWLRGVGSRLDPGQALGVAGSLYPCNPGAIPTQASDDRTITGKILPSLHSL